MTTENTETGTEPVQEATESPVTDEPHDEAAEPADGSESHTKPEDNQNGTESGKSESKLRKRAQAAEQQRDELVGQVEALQRQIVDDAVGRTGVPSRAFWSTTELATLLDDNGNVDIEAVTEAAETVRAEYRIARLPAPNPGQGSSANGAPDVSAQDAWKNAFKRR